MSLSFYLKKISYYICTVKSLKYVFLGVTAGFKEHDFKWKYL